VSSDNSKEKVSVGLIAVACAAVMFGIGAATGWHQADRAVPQVSPDLTGPAIATADLAAQQWMATWAMWMFAATSMQVLVGAVGLYYILASFRQSADAVDLARRTFAAERRTWMEITTADVTSASRTGGTIRVSMDLVAENVGHAPATDVHFFVRAIASGMFLPGRESAKQVAMKYLRETPLGVSVLPGRTASHGFHIEAGRDTSADESHRKTRELNGGDLPTETNLSVIYGVVYRSLGSDEWNYTVNLAIITTQNDLSFSDDNWDISGHELGLMQMVHFSQIA
jgi:hypothetical protein